MNKKLMSGILIFLIIFIIGFVILSDINKADTEVPTINSHIQNANKEYNTAVSYLNVKNYSQAIEHINTSYTEYIQAHQSSEKALQKASDNNKSVQVEYFNYTISELDYKINSTVELYNGLMTVSNSPSQALQYFRNSHQYMINATQYSDKRIQLEQQYPENFIK